ncbi:MAG: hydroxylamine reductase [Candidatus Zixiibacteriota bacterium]
MFCYQCEQSAKGTGCTAIGQCGKDPETAALQDILVWSAQRISLYANHLHKLNKRDKELDIFVVEALFTTVTNVNFDPARLKSLIEKADTLRKKARDLYETACKETGTTPVNIKDTGTFDPLAALLNPTKSSLPVGIETRRAAFGDDIAGLRELVMYGLKGMAAYADHALVLGREDDAVYAFIHEALDTLTNVDLTADELTALALKTGEVNIRVMELLDDANTGTYGHPEPTRALVTVKKGRAILVSGHDLKDLETLLKQTEGKDINIYTHGEMLPALAYPELKKYPHLVGNYGGAWQDQQKEFENFPGAVLMTTNCIQKPRSSYAGRIFTTGLVAWPGVMHVPNDDFTPVIDAALAADGFTEDEPERYITIGFARNAVLQVADKVIDAVKAGAIKHFFLVGGCDGAKPGRNYYTDFAKMVPEDCVILTLACGKFRFNKLPFGDIGGIPRLLDVGQCNDAYSAVKIALALADAFGTDINGLPLSLILSWYEQKAVVILLSLLHLGVKDIRLGPSLPAFISPNVLKVLVSAFNIKPVGTAEGDLKDILPNARIQSVSV